MKLRLATMNDLSQIKAMYEKIVDSMYKDNIRIWDEIYPCEFLHDDIETGRLYVLEENDGIASAFALCDSHVGANCMKWERALDKALYIDRLGVNVNCTRKGIGSKMLAEAIALAREKGANYLRLFVVDTNEPATNLYMKNGFERVEGIYDELLDDGYVLHEVGFEMHLQP